MTVWQALAGGFVATISVIVALRGASDLGLTRLDLPYLLGSALIRRRPGADALGIALLLLAGVGLAAGYEGAVIALDTPPAAGCLALGAGVGVVVAGVLLPLVLPLVHPRMAAPWARMPARAVIEPPGTLGLGYGSWTPAVVLGVHTVHGAIVGGFLAA